MRSTIYNAIQNYISTKTKIFTPQKPFEEIVKKEIERIEGPIQVCIDLVLKQLKDAIRLCINNVSVC